MKSKRAFTLIELLVIIVIIGILATLAAVSLRVMVSKARDGRRMTDISSIRKALELYKLNNEIYPPDNQFIVGAPLKNGNDLVIGKIPSNPKSVDGNCLINEYLYRQDNNGLSYHINWCLGGQVQDAGPGPCIATPNHYCAVCTGGTCTGKCGGENGCGQPCPTAACPSTTPNCDQASNYTCVCRSNAECGVGKFCTASGTCVTGNCGQDSDCGPCQKCSNNNCTLQSDTEDLKNECGTSNCFTGTCSGTSANCGVYSSGVHNCDISGGNANRACIGNADGSCSCTPSACGGTNGKCPGDSNGCGGTCSTSCVANGCCSGGQCNPRRSVVIDSYVHSDMHSYYCNSCGGTANAPYQVCGASIQEIGCVCCPNLCADLPARCSSACSASTYGGFSAGTWSYVTGASLGTKICSAPYGHYYSTHAPDFLDSSQGDQSCICKRTQWQCP